MDPRITSSFSRGSRRPRTTSPAGSARGAHAMVNHLRKDLEALERQLLYLAAQVEQSVRRSMTSLLERRRDLALAVIEGDDDIDRREVEIEEDCLKVLAL